MSSNINQFLMRHMPNALNGDFEYEVGEYVKNGDVGIYKNLAYSFFQNNDEPREYVANIFGTGKYKFWCFEHNLFDVPMYTMETIYDIIDTLEDIQVELDDDDTYTKNYKWFNLWCCTGIPFTNLIISSFNMSVSGNLDMLLYDTINTLCNVKDDHSDEITIDEHGKWIDTKEFESDVHEKTFTQLLTNHDILGDVIKKCCSDFSEQYPHAVFKHVDDGITYYEFINVDDTKSVHLNNFYDDIESLNIVEYDHVDDCIMVDGVDILEPYKKILVESLEMEFHRCYNENVARKEEGIIDFPKKTMDVYFK